MLNTLCSTLKWKCKWFKRIRLSSTFSKFIEFVVAFAVVVVNGDNQIKINWSESFIKFVVLWLVCTLSCEIVLLTFQLVSAVKLYWSFNQFKISVQPISLIGNSILAGITYIQVKLQSRLNQYKGVCVRVCASLSCDAISILASTDILLRSIALMTNLKRSEFYGVHFCFVAVDTMKNAFECENRIKYHLFCLNVIHRNRMQWCCSVFCLTHRVMERRQQVESITVNIDDNKRKREK